MHTDFTVITENDKEDFHVATVLELRGCHTQARSLDTLMERFREAIDPCLEEHGPASWISEFVGVQRISVEL